MGYPLESTNRYTYKDYLLWPREERWELIGGVPYSMSPAPSRIHQKICRELLRQFANYLFDKTCEVYNAPFDVRLPEKHENGDETTNVVQPDLVVVCDQSKLDEKGCQGGPDLVIEVLSPETAQKDIKEKFLLYEKAGVKEYWVVQPFDKTVMIFKLEPDGKYGRPEMFNAKDQIKVGIFESLTIDLTAVFKE